MFWSHNAKKNVFSLMIGPPKLRVYWLVFLQLRGVGFHLRVSESICSLLVQLLPVNLVLRLLYTALPRNSLVPGRVRTWICPLPRPYSASTGARITRTSPTMSGFIVVVAERTPVRVSVTVRPSRVVLIVLFG